MGVFAPVSQRLVHVIGREATLGAALVLLLLGLLLRLAGGVLPLLFLSTLLAGVGIVLCGTVLPGIVKEFIAHRPGVVTWWRLPAGDGGCSPA
jgi:MFS transporter, CP family, cyanate transporter